MVQEVLQRRWEQWNWGVQWPAIRSGQSWLKWSSKLILLQLHKQMTEYINHFMAVRHLKQIRKVKKLDKRVSHVVVRLLSQVWFLVTSLTAAHQASLSFIISQSLLKLMSIESVMPYNHLVICHPFILLPSTFPALGYFPTSLLFASCGHTTGGLVQSFNITQGWFPLGMTALIFLQFKGLSWILSSTTVLKASILQC